MSFDIHDALKAVKLYGLLAGALFVVAVLQPQQLLSLPFGDWTAHIGESLWLNLLGVAVVTAIVAGLDLFETRRPPLPKR